MLHSQIWYSDSCGCIFEEFWDDTDPEQKKTLKQPMVICTEHEGIAPEESFKQVHKECSLKEDVRKELLESNALPLSILDVQQTYIEDTRELVSNKILHKDIQFKYYFDSDRNIIFTLDGIDKNGQVLTLDNNQKASMTNVLSKFGNGKCIFKDLITENTDDDYKKSLQVRAKGEKEMIRIHHELQKTNEDKLKNTGILKKFFQ